MMRMSVVGVAAVIGCVGAYPLIPQSGMNGAPNTEVQSAAKRPMTFADLMAMKRVSDPRISPSGKWVLFSVMDVSLEKNTKTNHLWVVPLDGSAPERQVTTGPGESFGRFSPDGKWVSWTQNPAKDESFARIAIAGWDEKTGTVGTARSLTGISGDADGAVWSPDAKRLMLTTQVWPECSVSPTHDDKAVVNGAPRNTNAGVPRLDAARLALDDGSVGGVEIGGTNNVAAWKNAQPAAWAEEDACDKAKDEAAEKNPVKAQVWDGLLYRHWDQYTGAKRTHILVADVSPTHDDKSVMNGAPGKETNADPSTAARANARASAQDDTTRVVTIRDVTTARDVGDAETPTWMLGGPQEYAWSPDSKEIAYVTNLDAVPAASTNNDVFTLRVDEAAARPVKVSTSAGSDDEPEYSPDGKWLAFRSQRQAGFESDRERLMVSERVSGSASQQGSGREWGEPKELMPKFDRWVDEFAWELGSNGIFYAYGNDGQENVDFVFTNGRQMGFLEGKGEFSDIRPIKGAGSAAANFLVAARMTAHGPSEIVRLPANKPQGTSEWGGEVPLTHLNDALLSQLDLAPLEPFWFTGAEGTKVEGFLLRPPGFDPTKKYPLKFILHGGPQTMAGDSWSYRWNWELMAASGYVVIGINRRGSTGYGQKFVDEVSGDWGGRAYEDLMKGLDYAEANYPFIDKTRECALGASYGGFMADWILTHTNRFKCIVTHDGLYDAGAAWGATEEMWFAEWEFRRPEDYPKGWDGFSATYNPMGRASPTHAQTTRVNGPPEKTNTGVLRSAQDDGEKQATARTNAGVPRLAALARDDGKVGGTNPPKRSLDGAPADGEGHAAEPWRYSSLPAAEDPFLKWSPKEYIQNAKTPTLIIHSQKDYRLDVSQGFELYTALQRQGVASRFLYFPDEGHWVLKPKNSELWNAVVSDWCDRWTKTGKYAENAAK